jgi:glycosidase
MPWNSDTGAGFTTVKPWLPLGHTASYLNVEVESRQPESSLSMYRHLIHLRNESPALYDGTYRSLNVDNPYIYAYIRETEMQKFLIVLNFDKHHARFELKGHAGKWIVGTHEVQGDGAEPKDGIVTLEAYEGRVYELMRGAR